MKIFNFHAMLWAIAVLMIWFVPINDEVSLGDAVTGWIIQRSIPVFECELK